MSIAQRLRQIQSGLPPEVRLIAVSKTHPVESILEAVAAGQHVFGENRVQELVEKYQALPELEWHLIGHLQTNKVKYIAPFVHLIHGVDSLKLLKEINLQAAKNQRVIDCLLQMYIATEETKFGLDEEEIKEILESEEFRSFENVRICGIMGMATNTRDQAVVEKEFYHLHDIFQYVKRTWFSDKSYFCEISAGMSQDYTLAVRAGSTMVRIGSEIFGERSKY